jgi:hypothetical protein
VNDDVGILQRIARECLDRGHRLGRGRAVTAPTPERDTRAETLGRIAYEGFVAFQEPDDGFEYETWADKDETGDRDVMGRADWTAAAVAVAAQIIADVRAHREPEFQVNDIAQNHKGQVFVMQDDRTWRNARTGLIASRPPGPLTKIGMAA